MLREILNKNLLVSIYKALVESVIRYAIVVWGGLNKTSLYPLNIVQNSILKIIYKKTRLYHASLLYSESVLDARCLYILGVSKFMARVNNKKYISHKYQTRQKTRKSNVASEYKHYEFKINSIKKINSIYGSKNFQLYSNK